MSDLDTFKEQILKDGERLGPDDRFSFRCHPGLSCFNKCCGDVNIVLTPYDVLRLRRNLGLSSTEFIQKHTVRPFTKDQQLPVVLLKLEDSKPNKPCSFVGEQGCTVYADRPWACRMYPVGSASARTESDPDGPEFFFLMREEPCDGFKEGSREVSIREWMDDQKVGPYQDAGESFKQISLHPHFRQGGTLNPQQMEMFFTACYDLDRFRAFIFESSFLSKFEVEPALLETLRTDDEALLDFGVRWLRTSLFREGLIPVKDEARKACEQKLAAARPKQG
jgi:uncharacterized protein